MQRWFVSIITPVSWSFRNHSNMLICCSRILSMLKIFVLLNIFLMSLYCYFSLMCPCRIKKTEPKYLNNSLYLNAFIFFKSHAETCYVCSQRKTPQVILKKPLQTLNSLTLVMRYVLTQTFHSLCAECERHFYYLVWNISQWERRK